ncbi:hypothetical protein B0H16DRAFT_1884251 [Mycena metata]|uniref:Uncharacterized protein n=1 Tax=Mycena metata TaxID=1033252 RepID=A0AAD7JC25_9AGAR|nr:hypothetical protein B0H16DRAFT_1884251 [Mycena metata]
MGPTIKQSVGNDGSASCVISHKPPCRFRVLGFNEWAEEELKTDRKQLREMEIPAASCAALLSFTRLHCSSIRSSAGISLQSPFPSPESDHVSAFFTAPANEPTASVERRILSKTLTGTACTACHYLQAARNCIWVINLVSVATTPAAAAAATRTRASVCGAAAAPTSAPTLSDRPADILSAANNRIIPDLSTLRSCPSLPYIAFLVLRGRSPTTTTMATPLPPHQRSARALYTPPPFHTHAPRHSTGTLPNAAAGYLCAHRECQAPFQRQLHIQVFIAAPGAGTYFFADIPAILVLCRAALSTPQLPGHTCASASATRIQVGRDASVGIIRPSSPIIRCPSSPFVRPSSPHLTLDFSRAPQRAPYVHVTDPSEWSRGDLQGISTNYGAPIYVSCTCVASSCSLTGAGLGSRGFRRLDGRIFAALVWLLLESGRTNGGILHILKYYFFLRRYLYVFHTPLHHPPRLRCTSSSGGGYCCIA